jgi:hypothetical protein
VGTSFKGGGRISTLRVRGRCWEREIEFSSPLARLAGLLRADVGRRADEEFVLAAPAPTGQRVERRPSKWSKTLSAR